MIFKRWERRHCADPLETRLYKGGGGGSSASLSTTTVNQDSRAVLQDAVQVGSGSTATVNMYSADAEVLKTLAGTLPDAVTALGQMSATTLRDVGGAVVNLNKDSIAANSKAWDSTLQFGANVVDKMIDQMSEGYALAGKAVDSFTPTENKNADIGKYAMLAAAAVAAVVLLKGSK
ncbi:hypothetical protein [Variovorax sp. RCC_210]|uniref:hypothetical protein n=1 Tax=Variovorax sp. RCC_210 TaxID=3239217 RepID=UPI0035255C14